MGIFKRNRSWFIDYYNGSRRIREKVGCSKGQALRALSVRQSEIAQGNFKFAPKTGIPTFAEFADKYLELVSIHKRGHKVEGYIIQTLKTVFGRLRLSDLTSEDAEKFKAARTRQVRPATVNRELTVAKHILSKAAEWKLIQNNPFRGVRNLRVSKCSERVLQHDEENKLLHACDRVRSLHLRPVVVMALNTGMRRGELLSLEWAQVDLVERKIRVLNAKSSSGERVIPMNATVYDLVSKLAKRAASPLVFPSNRKSGCTILDLKKGFKKAVRLAGIRDIRFHDLRHTFATRLVQAGIDLITVQHLLGHAKITMTARYAHSPSEAKIAAVGRLDFAGVRSGLTLTGPQSDPTHYSGAGDTRV